jgi:hypothetical protein
MFRECRECRERNQHRKHGNLGYIWPQSYINPVILIIRTGFSTAAQKAGRKGKKRRNDEIEANDNGRQGPATIINSGNDAIINSSPSAGPSIRASKRACRRTYKANC